MSQKQLVLEKDNNALHKIESYMFKQIDENESERPITDVKNYIQRAGRQKYLNAVIGSLRSKYDYYVEKLMETNESIQQKQFTVFQDRCSYGLPIHYVEFKFEHATKGPIYFGLDMTTGDRKLLPSADFYLNKGFTAQDFMPEDLIISAGKTRINVSTKGTIGSKTVFQDSFKNSIQYFGVGVIPKSVLDALDSSVKQLYNEGFQLMGAKQAGSRKNNAIVKEKQDFIVSMLTALSNSSFTENLLKSEYNNLVDKRIGVDEYISWFSQLISYGIVPDAPRNTPFGTLKTYTDYRIPDKTANTGKEINEFFDFYTNTANNYLQQERLLKLPYHDPQSKNGGLYYFHHGSDLDAKVNNFETLCQFWKMMNENYTSAQIPYENEQIMRQDFVSLIDFRRKSWAMCTKIMNRISLLDSNTSEQDKQVQKICEALDSLNKKIKGNARLDIKEKIARMIETFINSPSFYTNNYLNISLTGGAGTGKTSIAQVLAKIFSALGLLATSEYTIHTRATLVGQYVGQTAPKTRNALIDSLEGVFFLDEAYALAQSSGMSDFDAFGVEAINEFINFMDKNKGKISIITAGYHTDIEKYWFGPNEGMRRRMPYQWKLLNYSFYDLLSILKGFYKNQQEELAKNITNDVPPLPSGLQNVFTDDALQNLFGKLIKSCDLYYKTLNNPAPKLETNEKDLLNCYALLKNQAGDVENIVAKFNEKYISATSKNPNFKLESADVDQVFSEIYFTYNPDSYILYSSYLTYPNKVQEMYNYFCDMFGCNKNQNTVDNLIQTVAQQTSSQQTKAKKSRMTMKQRQEQFIQQQREQNIGENFRSKSNESTPTYNPNLTHVTMYTDNADYDNEIEKINNISESEEDKSFYSATGFGRLRRNYATKLIKQNKHLLKDERHRRQALQLYLMSLHNTNHL